MFLSDELDEWGCFYLYTLIDERNEIVKNILVETFWQIDKKFVSLILTLQFSGPPFPICSTETKMGKKYHFLTLFIFNAELTQVRGYFS